MLGIARLHSLALAGQTKGKASLNPVRTHPIDHSGKTLGSCCLPDLRAAFSLVGQRVGGSVGVVACRVVAPVEVVDAVGRGAAGTV
jgi:hypothetical protein